MLQPIYFQPDVLEPYRENPRFNFRIEDFGVMFNITDEVFLDEDEPENENVSLLHGGLAYNMRRPADQPLQRAICILLTDLHDFPPDLQTRWSTFELPDQAEFERHPAWWTSQMGGWPDMIGPFTRMFRELNTLQAMHTDLTGEPLFNTTESPQEFGWILRPSVREFNRFVHDLDKLLSDNLRHKALDALGVPTVTDDGTRIGTLRRLELHLEETRLKAEARTVAMTALRRVRKLRQKPAHAISENAADPNLIEEQIRLIGDVTEALWVVRKLWESKGSSVAAPSHLDDYDSFVPL